MRACVRVSVCLAVAVHVQQRHLHTRRIVTTTRITEIPTVVHYYYKNARMETGTRNLSGTMRKQMEHTRSRLNIWGRNAAECWAWVSVLRQSSHHKFRWNKHFPLWFNRSILLYTRRMPKWLLLLFFSVAGCMHLYPRGSHKVDKNKQKFVEMVNSHFPF